MKPIEQMSEHEAASELKRRLDARARGAIEVQVHRNGESETKTNGLMRTVTFVLGNDTPNPFIGRVGERFYIVPIKINDDETLEHGQRASVAGDGCAAPRQPAAVGGPDTPDRPCRSPASGEVSPPSLEEPGGKGEEPSRRARGDRNYTLANKIAMTCVQKSFQRFLRGLKPLSWGRLALKGTDQDVAAMIVREHCGVASRAEISPDTEAARLWQDLELRYEQFQRDERAA